MIYDLTSSVCFITYIPSKKVIENRKYSVIQNLTQPTFLQHNAESVQNKTLNCPYMPVTCKAFNSKRRIIYECNGYSLFNIISIINPKQTARMYIYRYLHICMTLK